MSYCVNCGVELAESEKYCPLCNVETINPKVPWKEPLTRPYPHHLETLMKRVDRRYFATLAVLFLLIPVLVTILIDLLSGDGMTWSAFITGAMVLLYIFFVFPFYFKRYHPVLFLTIDSFAVLICLFFIERTSGGNWFFAIALPVSVTASVFVISTVLLCRKNTVSFLLKLAFILIAIGIFVMCIEVIINMHTLGILILNWSFYVLIPCIVLGIAAIILEQRKNLKEEIRRRMFY